MNGEDLDGEQLLLEIFSAEGHRPSDRDKAELKEDLEDIRKKLSMKKHPSYKGDK